MHTFFLLKNVLAITRLLELLLGRQKIIQADSPSVLLAKGEENEKDE